MLSKRLVGLPKLNKFNLGHRFARELNVLNSTDGVVIAVSGGADSMALLFLLALWRRRCKVNLAVVHVHHGRGDRQMANYRAKAERFVKDWCERLQLPVYLLPRAELKALKRPLQSEEDLRDWRWMHFERARLHFAKLWRVKRVWVATAHTSEDQLETRLMRLIRGTGPHGLRAMGQLDQMKWRPLLNFTKPELLDWLSQNEMTWLEDPSNQSLDPLRNWIRNDWLKRLEKRQRGAVRNLARSLERMAGAVIEPPISKSSRELNQLPRSEMQSQSVAEKRLKLALFLRSQGLVEFTQNHLDEILKRLDKTSKTSRFQLLGRMWQIDASGIATSRE